MSSSIPAARWLAGIGGRRAGSRPCARVRRPLQALAIGMVAMLALAGCQLSLGTRTTTTSGGGTTIPLRILKGQDNATLALVPVTINGKGPYSFILDTGASISLVDRSLAQQLNLPRSGARQPVSGIGGTEQVVFVDVKTWKVGNQPLPAGTIGSGALPTSRGGASIMGLLGSDIWSQFGKISIDYGAATLTVYKSLALRPDSGPLPAAIVAGATVWLRAA
jgi:Aspartyl protease